MLRPPCWKRGGQIPSVILKQVWPLFIHFLLWVCWLMLVAQCLEACGSMGILRSSRPAWATQGALVSKPVSKCAVIEVCSQRDIQQLL